MQYLKNVIAWFSTRNLNVWLVIIIAAGLVSYVWIINHWYKLNDSGPIGDAMGGILGTFVSICAAILVYKSFQAQVRANESINEQLKDDRFFKFLEIIILFKKEDSFQQVINVINSDFSTLENDLKIIYYKSILSESDYFRNYQNFELLLKQKAAIIERLIRLITEARKLIAEKKDINITGSYSVILDSLSTESENKVLDILYFFDPKLKEKYAIGYSPSREYQFITEKIEKTPLIRIDTENREIRIVSLQDQEINFENEGNAPLLIKEITTNIPWLHKNISEILIEAKSRKNFPFTSIFDLSGIDNSYQGTIQLFISLEYLTNAFKYNTSFEIL